MNNTMNQTLMTTSINTTIAAFDARQHQQQLLSWTWFLPIPLLLFCCVILPLLFFVDRCLLRHKHRDDDEETIMARARAIREVSTRNEAHKSSVENPLTKLNGIQRKNVYTQVFKRSQHSIVVTKEFFKGSNNKNNNKSESEKQKHNQEQEQQHESENYKSDQFVDIELGGEVSSSSSDEDTTTDNAVSCNERRSCCQSCMRKQQLLSTNDGTCIICFEEFAVGDVIVWSEDQDCSHIYHEECMIQYLTTKRRPKEIIVVTTSDNDSDTDGDSTNDHSENTEETEDTTSSNNDSDSDSNDTERDNRNDDVHKDHNTVIEKNPCPTCRRTFCTVTLEDLNSVTSRGMTTEKEVASC